MTEFPETRILRGEGDDLLLVTPGAGDGPRVRLPLGAVAIAKKFFRAEVPTEAEVENAINFIEDELMAVPGLVVRGGHLKTSDPVLADVFLLPGGGVLSSAEVEERFTQFAVVVMGRSFVSAGLSVKAVAFAALLVVREVIHHLGFTRLEVLPAPTIVALAADQTLDLRQRVLWPSKTRDQVRLAEDTQGRHWGVNVAGQIVSVVSVFVDGSTARFRKLATDPAHRGFGHGTRLLTSVFEVLRTEGVNEVWCDARLEAAPFYRRLGLEEVPPRFEKEGIPYVRMALRLEEFEA